MPPFESFTRDINNKALIKIKLPIEILKAGTYYLEGIFCRNIDIYDKIDSFIKIVVEPKNRFELSGNGIRGLLLNNNEWMIR